MAVKIINSTQPPISEPPQGQNGTPIKVKLDTSKVVMPTFDEPAPSTETPAPSTTSTSTSDEPEQDIIDKDGTVVPKKKQRRLTNKTTAKVNPDRFSQTEMNSILEEGNLRKEDAPQTFLPEEQRAGDGRRLRSTSEGADFRRKQVHRLLLRGVPRISIAQHLGVSLDTVHADAKIITQDMRRELQELDYTVYIGQAVSFFDECRNIALRLATDTAEKSNSVKMQAVRTAIEAEKAKNDFFSKVGLFKMVSPTDPFHAINTGRQGSYSDENDLNSFMQLIASAAKGEVELALPAPTPTAPEAGNGN